MYRWAFVSEGMENNNVDCLIGTQVDGTSRPNRLVNGNGSTTTSDHDVGGTSSQTLTANCQKPLYQQDFVPYVVRVARLLLQKVRFKS